MSGQYLKQNESRSQNSGARMMLSAAPLTGISTLLGLSLWRSPISSDKQQGIQAKENKNGVKSNDYSDFWILTSDFLFTILIPGFL